MNSSQQWDDIPPPPEDTIYANKQGAILLSIDTMLALLENERLKELARTELTKGKQALKNLTGDKE